jgi:nucleoside-diphosphate kinase
MHKSSTHFEQTLVIVKPDGVQRGLVGEIVSRFEKKGLKLVAMKMVWPTLEQAKSHYFWSDEEKLGTGNRTIDIYKEKGIPLAESDPLRIAESVQEKLFSYLTTGPVVVFVLEGAHAIAHVRTLVGHGSPLKADVGSIRSDYSIDSYEFADEFGRPSRNLIHASGNVKEAQREMKVWFSADEIVEYDLAIDKILYDPAWQNTLGKLTKADK